MGQHETEPKKKLSTRELNLITRRVGCSREYVRLISSGQITAKTRIAKKIVKGAKIIIANNEKLNARLDAELLDQE
ncbi:MAG TPA: hypothetical protein VN698_09670 [Bacteroidia bacterium]|nr:hypothetical protein [Bacteroidia bacterium]